MSELADALGAAILTARSDTDTGPGAGAESRDALALVRRTASAEQAVGELLGQAVGAARAEGHSWAAIGAELGMSRQAAQQRFGARAEEGADEGADREERWLGPVTAFDEMHELDLAGRLGWHTVGAGMLRHRMVRTSTQWENRRVAWVRLPGSYEKDGWQIGAKYFPWLYLVRDTGRPAEE